MFERFSESARRALFFTRLEAGELGATSIEAEHLLLGVIREPQGVCARIFSSVQLSFEQVRTEVAGRALSREKTATAVEMPFSDSVKQVLAFAAAEADRFKHALINPEHLLIGLLRDEGSMAASILRDHYLRPGNVRDAVERYLGEPFDESGTDGEPRSLLAAIAHVRRLIEYLGQAEVSPFQRSQMVEKILQELDAIKERLDDAEGDA